MTAVNHFHSEQLTDCTHTSDGDWSRGDTDKTAQIAGASLSVSTKYLIIARAMLQGSNGNVVFKWRITTADDTGIAAKSEMWVEPITGTTPNLGVE